MPDPDYLTLSQVAMRTGRHPELLRQWCARGRIPCARVGGSWVLRERDLSLVDGIARRARRPHRDATPSGPEETRIIAAVFDDDTLAETVAEALRERLRLAHDAIGTTSLGLSSVAPLRLSVVAGRFPGPASVEARRIVVGYGGRIVADIDEAAAAEENAPAGSNGTHRHDAGRRGYGGSHAAEETETRDRSPSGAASR
jgi:hypothetical protein